MEKTKRVYRNNKYIREALNLAAKVSKFLKANQRVIAKYASYEQVVLRIGEVMFYIGEK